MADSCLGCLVEVAAGVLICVVISKGCTELKKERIERKELKWQEKIHVPKKQKKEEPPVVMPVDSVEYKLALQAWNNRCR